MNLLILSCDTGEGHNAAAKAVQEAAKARGHFAEVLDIMLLSGLKASHAVGKSYVNIVKYTPHIFGFIYKLGMFISSSKHKSPVYYANALLAKKLEHYITEHSFDAIVTTHLYPAETLTHLKRKGRLKLPAVAVQTDYTLIPFWEETELDAYILPHEDLVEECVSRGLPKERLYPYGIPTGLSFCAPKDTSAARLACHLPPQVPVYLIMSGSMGFGRLALFSHELARKCKDGEHIIIICGSNEKLQKTLQFEFRGRSNVHVLGYTHHVSRYMDACDVIFTKPGGLSSTEALVKNIPIIHTAPIPGCETKNRNFFVSRHLSLSSRSLLTQIHLGRNLIQDEAARIRIRDAQKEYHKPNASLDIIALLETITKR